MRRPPPLIPVEVGGAQELEVTKDTPDPKNQIYAVSNEISKSEGGSALGSSIFDDLAALRTRQDFDNLVRAQRIRTRVPVAKPGRQTWFRAHPDAEWSMQAYLLDWEEDGTQFFVIPEIGIRLGADVKRVELRTVVTPQQTASLWPIRLPNADGSDNEWFASARHAASQAETAWIRIVANREARGYDVYRATADFGEPVWPDEGFAGLLKIAFAGKIVEGLDHPVVQRLLGRSS
jgi:hypothetical protein